MGVEISFQQNIGHNMFQSYQLYVFPMRNMKPEKSRNEAFDRSMWTWAHLANNGKIMSG